MMGGCKWWSVPPRKHSCSSYYKAQSAQESPPRSSPILWYNLQSLESPLCAHRMCLPCLYPQHPGRGCMQSWLRGDLLA